MPDSSDSSAPPPQPPQAPPPGQAPDPSAGKTGAAAPLSLVPRNKSGTSKDSAPAEQPAGSAASFTDFMHWMKAFAASSAAETAEPPPPTGRLGRSTLPKEQRKFQRYDREQAGAAEAAIQAQAAAAAAPDSRSLEGGAAAESESDIEEEEERAVPAGRPVPIALTGGTSGRRLKPTVRRQPLFWLWLQAGALALIVVSFVLGRISVPKAVAPVKNAAPAAPGTSSDGSESAALSPDAAKLIDDAMADEQDRKFNEASDLLLKVKKDYPHVRDLDFHLATIAVEANDASKALPLLNETIAEGEQAGAAYKLRGTILNRKGGVTRGMIDFESATKVDPFTAENFYFWGEALRRSGKPQAALVRLQEAMDRLREPALESQYRLKMRLTQIELGQEQEFAAEMARRLAENPPPPDWLLTAAAVALQHHDFPAAASELEKASLYLDKDAFAMRMRDYFFYGYHLEKSLAKFFDFNPPAPAAEANAPRTPNDLPASGPGATPDTTLPDAAKLLRSAPAPSPEVLPSGAH